MKAVFLRFRRKQNNFQPPNVLKQKVVDNHNFCQPSGLLQLYDGDDAVRSIVFSAEQNAIISANRDGFIRLYELDTKGYHNAVFANHKSYVAGLTLIHLDLAASVSTEDKLLLTWRVSETRQVGQWTSDKNLTAIAKLDSSHIIVGDWDGGLVVLNHSNGSSLRTKKKICNKHSDWIYFIAVHRNIFVTCSFDKTAIVWNATSYKSLVILNHEEVVRCAAINDSYIITATKDKKLYVFHNVAGFNLICILDIPHVVNHIQFLDNDSIAVACDDGFLDFISISQKSFNSRCNLSSNHLKCCVFLPDARIAVGGEMGFSCIFQSPQQVETSIRTCVTRLYPNPLRSAWDAVQRGRMSLEDACTTFITSSNCQSSLDEWCIAHNILMRAVESRTVPPSRHFKNFQIHWHRVLYRHCAKLPIGENDIDFLVSLFIQAESAGVIATGTAESLLNIISVRQDLVKETRLITNAVYELCLRQADADIRLQQLLRYQRAQQLAALMNAILGCVPVVGSIATNLISGSASVLNELETSGLVESLLGAGKEFVALGSDNIANELIRRSNVLLKKEAWEKLPDHCCKAIEDATRSIGLTVEHLRERFLQITEMNELEGINARINVIAEESKPSKQ